MVVPLSRSDAEHVSEAFGRGAARVGGSVLRGLLFGPGHLNSPMMLRAAAAAATTAAHRSFPLSSVGIIIIIRADAGQPQHGVAVLHQLGLVCTHKHVFFSSQLSFFLFRSYALPPSSTPLFSSPTPYTCLSPCRSLYLSVSVSFGGV